MIATAGEEERRVGAGTIALMEDTAWPGHGLTVLTDRVMAVVRLEPVGVTATSSSTAAGRATS